MANRQQTCCFLHMSAMLFVLGLPTPTLAKTKRDPIDLVYVASRVSGDIAMIDSRDDRVVGHVTLDRVPDQFVLSETRRLLVAAHVDARSVSLFDLESMQPRAELTLGFSPDQIQLDDKSGMVAVAGSTDGRLALIALDSSAIVGRIEGLTDPTDLIFDKSGERLFVAGGSDAWIDIVDIAGGRVTGRPETSLAVEAGTKLYVTLSDTDQVAVLDMTQPRLMGTIDNVIDAPWAVNAAGSLGYCH